MPAWIKIESALRRHRKVIRLGKYLGLTDERTLIGGLVLLWLAVRESAPDGNITDWNAAELACAAGFEQADADRLYFGLHDCGFLEHDDGTVRVHDWMEHNGQFTRDAERKRRARASKDRPEQSPDVPGCPRMSPDVPGCPRLARAPGAGAGARAVQESKSTTLSDPVGSDDLVLTPPSPKRDTGKTADTKDWREGFAEFWLQYPHRANSSKKQALELWMRFMPRNYRAPTSAERTVADDLFSDILAALEKSKQAWKRDGTDEAHIPHHVVWLRRELWRNDAQKA